MNHSHVTIADCPINNCTDIYLAVLRYQTFFSVLFFLSVSLNVWCQIFMPGRCSITCHINNLPFGSSKPLLALIPLLSLSRAISYSRQYMKHNFLFKTMLLKLYTLRAYRDQINFRLYRFSFGRTIKLPAIWGTIKIIGNSLPPTTLSSSTIKIIGSSLPSPHQPPSRQDYKKFRDTLEAFVEQQRKNYKEERKLLSLLYWWVGIPADKTIPFYVIH